MKIVTFIVALFSGALASAEDSDKSNLLEQVVAAAKTESSIQIGVEDEKRTILIRDINSQRSPKVEPIILVISKVIERNYFPELRQITPAEARVSFQEYSAAVTKAGAEPVLELWLSKNTDPQLLKQVMEAVCPIGRSTVWIQYNESNPVRRDPRFIPLPVVPTNQKIQQNKSEMATPRKPSD